MDQFAVSPDGCLILKAFRDSSSLREAAALLGCDPAGLARRVQVISRENGYLHKVNNRWQVTSRGLDLVAWMEECIQSQKKIISGKNNLRIGSTMWFSESQIVPHLPELAKILGGQTSLMVSVPEKGFEPSLVGGELDFVIVCHPPENPEIEHRQIATEKWIAVAPAIWEKDFKGKKLEILKTKPFIRHASLNEDLFLPDLEIHESGIVIDHLMGVRAAVEAGLGWSLVPQILVHRQMRENILMEIPYEVPVYDRKICVWWLRNRRDSKRHSAKICAWMKDICT